MAYNPPTKNVAWRTYITLADANDANRLKSSPTIAAGDFKVQKDGGAFANLTTLPSVAPAASVSVQIDLSATEMNADNVMIVWKDQTDPPEWADNSLTIVTTA